MRILVVEDEANLREQLTTHLRGEGYAVDVAVDGEEGFYYGSEYPVDAAVIDLGLPKIDGVDLIKSLRAAKHDFPILVLTARSHWQDKVGGLDAGADDYLTKPFQMEELVARLSALIRRSTGHATPVIVCAELSLDISRKVATLQGKTMELTAFEYRVLEYLMLNQDHIVSKTELTEHLYEQDFDRDSNVLEVFVGRLRKKIAPLNLIKTIRGQGYRFSAANNDA
jgi:two-component system response regulator PhoP|tara:strand:- start:662 stop:1336 length:675 start_codon:yes stop_codon:yes gene_type:complete